MMTIDQETFERLKRGAVRAASHSHSPYSRFRVGAAVMADSGAVYTGCNVENASFGLTQCAERAALTAAISAGEDHTNPLLVLPRDTPYGFTGPSGVLPTYLSWFVLGLLGILYVIMEGIP